MGIYKKPSSKAEASQTKWDSFKIHKTGFPYRCQKGSAREVMFGHITEGMTVKTWLAKCAESGYSSSFAMSSLLKYMTTAKCAFKLSEKTSDGTKLSDVTNLRSKKVEKKERVKSSKPRTRARSKRTKVRTEKLKEAA